MIYLSWSIYQLVVVLVLELLLLFAVLKLLDKSDYLDMIKEKKKLAWSVWFGVLVLTMFIAVDVGDTKAVQYRNTFNVETGDIPSKTEVLAPTKESVYNGFLQTLDTNEVNQTKEF